MKKFLVLYKASQESFQQMMKATPEQQKAGMDAWNKWASSPQTKAMLVDMGSPLAKTVKVAKGGAVTPTHNDLGGYSIMQGESKEQVAEKLKEHPHFMMGDGWIEVVEIMPIPGM